MKRFTTSAQKTVKLAKGEILAKLEQAMAHDFRPGKRPGPKEADLPDGSKLVIAAFDKEDGRTLAMIDFENIPRDRSRKEIQQDLRRTLDSLFGS